jgi:thymidine kinase
MELNNKTPRGGRRHSKSGEIQLICGPMFSGKSTELIRRMRRHIIAKRRCFMLRPFADKRTDAAEVHSHDGITKLPCNGVFGTLAEFIATRFHEGWDVVGIDEGQMLCDLVQGCTYMANAGCSVIVAACDRMSDGQPFGDTIYLSLEAEHVDKLKAVCAICQSENAIYSILRDHVPKPTGSTLLVGGSELYYAACRRCRPPAGKGLDYEAPLSTPGITASPYTLPSEEEETRPSQEIDPGTLCAFMNPLPEVLVMSPLTDPLPKVLMYLPKERWRYDGDLEFDDGSLPSCRQDARAGGGGINDEDGQLINTSAD